MPGRDDRREAGDRSRGDADRDVVPVLLGLLRRIDARTADLDRRLDAQAEAIDDLRRAVASPPRMGAPAPPDLTALTAHASADLDRRFAALTDRLAAQHEVAAPDDATADGLQRLAALLARTDEQVRSLRGDLATIEDAVLGRVERAVLVALDAAAGIEPADAGIGDDLGRAVPGDQVGHAGAAVIESVQHLAGRLEQRDRALATRLDRLVEGLTDVGTPTPAPPQGSASEPATGSAPAPGWALDLTEAVDATTSELERIGVALDDLVGAPHGTDGAGPAIGALQRRHDALEAALRTFGEGVVASLDDLRSSIDALVRRAQPAGDVRLARLAAAEARLEQLAAERAALASRLPPASPTS